MKIEIKDLSSNDSFWEEPGKLTLINEAAEDSVVTDPKKTVWEDAEGNKTEIKPTGIKISNAAGDVIEITLAAGLVITKSGKTGSYQADSASLDDGSGSTAELSTADGLQHTSDGATLSATAFSVELSGSGNTATLSSAAGLQLNIGSNTMTLDGEHLALNVGGDTATLSPTGLEMDAAGYVAALSAGDGLHLEGSGGGTVDIAAIDGEAISLQDTKACDEVDGVATPKTAKFLRGEEHDV